MEIVTHRFAWETDRSHAIFWRYQKHQAERAPMEMAKLIALCRLQLPATVPDVGCGLGLHLAAFGQHGFVGIGIEVSVRSGAGAAALCSAPWLSRVAATWLRDNMGGRV